MALVVPTNGQRITLEYLVNKSRPQDLTLRLYSNDRTPEEKDSAALYSEIRGAGYNPVVMNGASWSVAVSDADDGPPKAAYPEQVFTFNAPAGKVYGYFITRSITGDLVWAERFSTGPFESKNKGDQLKVTPLIEGSRRKT